MMPPLIMVNIMQSMKALGTVNAELSLMKL